MHILPVLAIKLGDRQPDFVASYTISSVVLLILLHCSEFRLELEVQAQADVCVQVALLVNPTVQLVGPIRSHVNSTSAIVLCHSITKTGHSNYPAAVGQSV